MAQSGPGLIGPRTLLSNPLIAHDAGIVARRLPSKQPDQQTYDDDTHTR
jgi:hypothetical protein